MNMTTIIITAIICITLCYMSKNGKGREDK